MTDRLEAPYVLIIRRRDEPERTVQVWTFHTLREALDFDARIECRRYFLHGEAARDFLIGTADRRGMETA